MSSLLTTLKAAFDALIAEDLLPAAATSAAAKAPATPQAKPAESPQVQVFNLAEKGVHLAVRLKPTQLVASAELLDRHGFAIDAITGVDWLAQGEMEVVYDYILQAIPSCHVAVHVRVPRERPEVPTISHLFPGANWHERETAEFFGITFLGHPNLIPLLLPEDATFHPLRKDFAGA